ncbi:MAG TPA: ATP-binding protein [Thermoanaerobaculia bacterium]|jgi:signal transduction histidine kinase
MPSPIAMQTDGLAEALVDAFSDPVWIVNGSLEVIRSNAAFARLGLADSVWLDLARRVFGGRSVSSELRAVVDGVERSFRISGAPAFRNHGIDAAVFVARDVTPSARAERDDLLELAVTQIFASEEPFDATLTNALEFLCESDDWDCAVLWLVDGSGARLEAAAVWSRPELAAAKFHTRIRELEFARGHGLPGRAWAAQDVVWVADLFDETGFVRAESAARAGLHGAAACPLRDANRIVGVLEVLTRTVRPMSEQRRSALARAGNSLGRLIVRRKLHELIERKGQEWSLTFDAIELPIFITRTDGTITRVNRAARDLTGSDDFTDLLGRDVRIGSGEPWTTLADTAAAVRDSRTPCSAQVVAGHRAWDVNASWYRSASDDAERIIIVMRDVTALIQLQESVRRGEQLSALGELVAGVAHEVKNPIFGIGLTVDAMQSILPNDPEVMELFSALRTWLDRLNRLMESLLEYGKPWTLHLRGVDLGDVIAPVVDGCRQIAAQNSVTVEAEVPDGLRILADPDRLSHAIENLITNAIQHSKPGQRVSIAARRTSDGEQELIECSVRDRGHGFDALDLPRIFQPFFTRRRGGTGLGLAIVQRIVDEHGGTIAAQNAEDGGAVLTMRFPAYRES